MKYMFFSFFLFFLKLYFIPPWSFFLMFLQGFEDWVKDTEEHGFVVVSFGAGVKYLSSDIAHKLAGALARLPQRVIWR